MEELTEAQKAFLEENQSEETDAPKPEEETQDEPQEASPEPKEETDSEEKPEESPGTPYTGKFKQFTTQEELEKAYGNSFGEAKRLNDVIKGLESEKEELVSQLDSLKSGESTDESKEELAARLRRLEEKDKEKEDAENADHERNYYAWMEEHPDVRDNPVLIADLLDEMAAEVRKYERRNPGKTPGMREALDLALAKVNPESKSETEDLETAAKIATKAKAATDASPGSNTSNKPKTRQLTESEKKTAKTYGMTDEEYLEFKG